MCWRRGVSRTTVIGAYRLLRDEGFVRTQHGSGSVIVAPPGRSVRRSAAWLEQFSVRQMSSDEIDLFVAAPVSPGAVVAAAMSAAAARATTYLAGHGYDAAGLRPLRAAVAGRFTDRGLPTTPDQVLVTAGAQQALDLAYRLLVRRGDRVVVDSPTYAGGLALLRHVGARLSPVPLTSAGWDLGRVEAAMSRAPALASLTVDFHNPTGFLLDHDGRVRIAAMARRYDVRVLVDETLVELDLDGRQPAPLGVLIPNAITVGSASKALWGGFRIGWLRADTDLVRRAAALRAGLDLASPVLDQLAVQILLDDFDVHLHETLDRLRTQHAALLEGLQRHLPDWEVTSPSGGMSAWVRWPGGRADELAARAEAYGVRIAPGPKFSADGTHERFLRLPFVLPPDELDEGLRRLARAAASGPGPMTPSPRIGASPSRESLV